MLTDPSLSDLRRLFVFAGAGASAGMPAALPMFNAIRDELLLQIELGDRVPGAPPHLGDQLVVAGLAAEPFLLAVQEAGVKVEAWLGEWLSQGVPNAVHVALGQLLTGGANVWTVNFDRLIESTTSPPLRVAAWPDPPAPKTLRKPHGSLGGSLIFTAKDVLQPLSAAWARSLEQDLETASHVVFIGYSARDLDLQPLWRRLTAGKQVIWFDYDLPVEEEQRRRTILRDATRIDFCSRPANGDVGTPPDPSAAFVAWCEDRGYAQVPSGLLAELSQEREKRTPPRLRGDRELGKAAVLLILGDSDEARHIHLRRVVAGRGRWGSARAFLAITLNVGAPGLLPVLRLVGLIRAPGRMGDFAGSMRVKRLTLLSNAGEHDKVLSGTRHIGRGATSSLLTLRSLSLRVVGRLPEAVEAAQCALVLARTEQHNVRIAHAAMQLCYAEMWSGHMARAELTLEDELRPMAALAATRWVAWADVLEGSLAVHRGESGRALGLLDAAHQRFRAEGLIDGSVSALTVKLTALRQAGDRDGFREDLAELDRLRAQPAPGRYYARGHIFSQEAVDLELAEFTADFEGDREAAVRLLKGVSRSHYAVHASIAELYLARHVSDSERDHHVQRALDLGLSIGAQKVVQLATQAAAHPGGPAFFP